MPSDADTVKVTVNLPRKVVEALEEIANAKGITKTEALRRAISTEKFLVDEVEAGNKILLEGKDRKLREVMLR